MILKTALALISLSFACGQDMPPPPPDLRGIPGEDPVVDPPLIDSPFVDRPVVDPGVVDPRIVDPHGESVPDPFGLDASSSTQIVYTPELRATMREFNITEEGLKQMLDEQKRTGKPATLTVMENGVEKTVTWDFSQLQAAGAAIDDATLKRLREIGLSSSSGTPSTVGTSTTSSRTTSTVSRTSDPRVLGSASSGLQAVLGGPESQLGRIVDERSRTVTDTRRPTGISSAVIDDQHSHEGHSHVPSSWERVLSGSVSSGVGTVPTDGVGTVDMNTGTIRSDGVRTVGFDRDTVRADSGVGIDRRMPVGPDAVDPMTGLPIGDPTRSTMSADVSGRIDAMIERINRMRQDLFRRRPRLTEQEYAVELARVEQEERRLREMITQDNMRARRPFNNGPPRTPVDVAAIEERRRMARQLDELRRMQEDANRQLQRLSEARRMARIDAARQRQRAGMSEPFPGEVDTTSVDPFIAGVTDETNMLPSGPSARRDQTRMVSTGQEQPERPGQNTGNAAALADEQRRIQEHRARLREEYENLRQEMIRYENALQATESRPSTAGGMRPGEIRRPMPPVSRRPPGGMIPPAFDRRGPMRGLPRPLMIPDSFSSVEYRVNTLPRRMRPFSSVAGPQSRPFSVPQRIPTIRGSTTIRGRTTRRIDGNNRLPYSDGDITVTSMTYDGMFDNAVPREFPITVSEPYSWERTANRRYLDRFMRPVSGFSSSTSGMISPWFRPQRIIRTTDTNPPFISGAQSINYFPGQTPVRRRITF